MKLPRLSPLKLFTPALPQFAGAGTGGSMMFAQSSGGSGGGTRGGNGGDDSDYPDDAPDEAPRTKTPRGSSSGAGGSGGRQRTVQFQPEERYWTEYLRIALPVIGLLLMLGLFWFWAQRLIDDGSSGGEPTATTESIGSTDIISPTLAPATLAPTEAVVAVTTNPPVATSAPADQTGDNQAAEPTAEPGTPPAAAIEIGSIVVTIEEVNLRPEASTTGDPVAVIPVGTIFNVIGGPETGDDYTWWQVEDDAGDTGWVVEEFIQVAP